MMRVVWVGVVLLSVLMAYKFGVMVEKVGQLEDCVFNQRGCYDGKGKS